VRVCGAHVHLFAAAGVRGDDDKNEPTDAARASRIARSKQYLARAVLGGVSSCVCAHVEMSHADNISLACAASQT
jgi:hypothetical protein